MTKVAIGGGFDPMHPGHIRYIEEALKLGDSLIVILTRDDQLMDKDRLLGNVKNRMPIPYEVRKANLEWGLKGRGVVVENIDKDITSQESLRRYRPDIFAKGGDSWDLESLPEREVCEELGIKIIFGVGGYDKLYSSSNLMQKGWGATKRDVTVILPTRNEAKSLGKVIHAIKALPIECEILVVDGLSTDKTPEVANSLGVTVLYETRKGKGIAVRTALRSACTPYIVMIDADGTYPVDVIPAFCAMLSKYDVVKGNRYWGENGALTKTHRFGNWALSLLASILFGYRVKDVCSGLWALRREKLQEFNLTSVGFTLEADLFVNSVRTGCRFKELPIGYKKRIQGDKAKLMLRDGFEIGWFLIKRRLRA